MKYKAGDILISNGKHRGTNKFKLLKVLKMNNIGYTLYKVSGFKYNNTNITLSVSYVEERYKLISKLHKVLA